MKKSTNTAVTIISGVSVPDSLAQIDAKLKSLKHISDSTYTISMSFNNVDLKKETKVDVLIKVLSAINGKEKAYNEAATLLGLGSYPSFSEGGGATEAWTKDIRLRIDIINSKDTYDKLKEYKDKMATFLSQQDQKAMLEAEMNQFLTSIA